MSTVATDFLTIVSGLPRSGTSMMMRMLEQGGLPVLIDNERKADDDNPNGYYEFEAVKRTREDDTWLDGSEGKAVKMVYKLLYDLPKDRSYRVVFMTRNSQEILASQRVMLNRHGLGDGVTDDQMQKLFTAELNKFYDWATTQLHLSLIKVDYNSVQEDPRRELELVNEFLFGILNVDAMVEVVDGALYRNRR